MDISSPFNRPQTRSPLWVFFLVSALLFAIFHVSQHEIEIDNGHVEDSCQVCRLAHFHGAALPTISLITPIFLCLAVLVTTTIALSSSNAHHNWQARAPPLLPL